MRRSGSEGEGGRERDGKKRVGEEMGGRQFRRPAFELEGEEFRWSRVWADEPGRDCCRGRRRERRR